MSTNTRDVAGGEDSDVSGSDNGLSPSGSTMLGTTPSIIHASNKTEDDEEDSLELSASPGLSESHEITPEPATAQSATSR